MSMGRPLRVRALGASMRPLLRSGTLVRISPLSIDEPLHVGDVVLSSVGPGLILHRIVGLHVDRGSLVVTTRGDGRRAADAPVPRASVLGRVDEVERAGWRFKLDRPEWRVAGYLAARLLPYLWRFRKA